MSTAAFSTAAPEGRLGLAADALTQVMAYYKHSMTELEVKGWWRLIDEFGDEAIVSFLQVHMERDSFRPGLDQVLKMLAPSRRSSTAAYEELGRQVRECGPYRAPTFQDPALPGAVVLLGGWVVVNEQMPLPDGSFESGAYIKRFDSMYLQAVSDALLHRSVNSRLRGLHDLSAKNLLGYEFGALPVPKPANTANVGVAMLANQVTKLAMRIDEDCPGERVAAADAHAHGQSAQRPKAGA